jgi:hypothetical protein
MQSSSNPVAIWDCKPGDMARTHPIVFGHQLPTPWYDPSVAVCWCFLLSGRRSLAYFPKKWLYHYSTSAVHHLTDPNPDAKNTPCTKPSQESLQIFW